jgi:hypothetical protein
MSTPFSICFRVTDAVGDPVTDLVDDDFTCALYRDGGDTTDAATVTVVQAADGVYKAGGVASTVDRYHVVVRTVAAGYSVNGQKRAAVFDVDVRAVVAGEAARGVHWTASGLADTDEPPAGLTYASGHVLWRPGGAPPAEESVDPQVAAVFRIRGNASEMIAVDDAAYYGGIVVASFDADPDDWRPGDAIYVSFSGPTVTVDGVTTVLPPLEIFYRISRERSIVERGVLGATHAVTVDARDPLDAPVPGVVLLLTDTSDVAITQVVTDVPAGRASFAAEEGTYRLHPWKAGYGFAAGFFERTVTGPGALDPIEAVPLATAAPADPGRCRVYHYADDADAPAASLSGTATPHPRPQFVGAQGGASYVGLAADAAPLAMAASGLFYFEGLKRGGTYLFEIEREGIDARNGVMSVPTDFTGGMEGIAYLIQDEDGRLAITVVAPED